MRIDFVAIAVLAAVELNCGGDKPPAQDPSATPSTLSTDPDAATPANPTPAPLTK
jgi:hypothetical protein